MDNNNNNNNNNDNNENNDNNTLASALFTYDFLKLRIIKVFDKFHIS
jgi:hypothetical protein